MACLRAAGIALLLGLLSTPVASAGSGEKVVVALGDSLTAGLGVAAEAWPALVDARLGREGYPYRVVNAGVSGDGRWPPPRGLGAAKPARRGRSGAWRERRSQGPPGPRPWRRTSSRSSTASVRAGHAPRRGMEVPPNYGAAYARAFRGVFVDVARRTGAALMPFLPGRRRGRSAPEPGRWHPPQCGRSPGHRRAHLAPPGPAPRPMRSAHCQLRRNPHRHSCGIGTASSGGIRTASSGGIRTASSGSPHRQLRRNPHRQLQHLRQPVGQCHAVWNPDRCAAALGCAAAKARPARRTLRARPSSSSPKRTSPPRRAWSRPVRAAPRWCTWERLTTIRRTTRSRRGSSKPCSWTAAAPRSHSRWCRRRGRRRSKPRSGAMRAPASVRQLGWSVQGWPDFAMYWPSSSWRERTGCPWSGPISIPPSHAASAVRASGRRARHPGGFARRFRTTRRGTRRSPDASGPRTATGSARAGRRGCSRAVVRAQRGHRAAGQRRAGAGVPGRRDHRARPPVHGRRPEQLDALRRSTRRFVVALIEGEADSSSETTADVVWLTPTASVPTPVRRFPSVLAD